MTTWIGHVVWPNYIVLPSIGGKNWPQKVTLLRHTIDTHELYSDYIPLKRE